MVAEEKVAIFLHTRHPGTDIPSHLSEMAVQQQSCMKKGFLSKIDIYNSGPGANRNSF